MKKDFLVISSIILLSTLLGLSVLTYGQAWYGDFSSYIMQARSILSGTMNEFVTRNAFTVDHSTLLVGPVAYPWGYPTLLAPAYALYGMKPIYLKLPNIVLFALFLACFFMLLRRRLDLLDSALLTSVASFSPALVTFLDQILSDIPFLLFSTLSLLLIDFVVEPKRPRKRLWLWNVFLGAVIFWAFFTRTNGILLLPVLAIYQFFNYYWSERDWIALKKNLGILILPYVTFGILAIVALLIFPGGQASYFSHYALLDMAQLSSNVHYYSTLMGDFFAGLPASLVIYYVTVAFFILGALVTFRREYHFVSYVVLSLLLFVTWPEPQGLRFIFPLIPLFLYFSFQGMKWSLKKLSVGYQPLGKGFVYGWWGLIALLFLVSSVQTAYTNLSNQRAINGPFDPYSNAMFEFVRQETPAESVIVFFKPRVMHMLTNRDSLLIDHCDLLGRGDYVVINTKRDEKYGQVNPNELPACNPDLASEPVFSNRRFVVYQVQK